MQRRAFINDPNNSRHICPMQQMMSDDIARNHYTKPGQFLSNLGKVMSSAELREHLARSSDGYRIGMAALMRNQPIRTMDEFTRPITTECRDSRDFLGIR